MNLLKEWKTMFEIITPIDNTLLKFVKKNQKLAVEYAKEILIKEGISYNTNKNFTTFNIDNTRYLVRISKGSSSEKGIGRKNIVDSKFPQKFDQYLYPHFRQDRIIFLPVPKY